MCFETIFFFLIRRNLEFNLAAIKLCFIIQKKINSSAQFILQQLKQRTFLTGCKRTVIFFEWVELMMNLSERTNQIMYGCPRFWHNNQYFPGLLKFLVIISSLLSFTTALANISILFALPEVTSVHPPSKPLLRSLTMTDFGSSLIAQPLAITMILSFSAFVAPAIFSGVSLSKLTTISLDRLLALLLGIRYRHVVTFRRVRAVVFFHHG